MNRLQTELRRLYGSLDPAATDPTALVDAEGRTRALVLELGRPAQWEPLATVWAGVQAELGLPAPAIAVSGRDAMQLWFSLAEPVDRATGHAALQTLCARWLPDLPVHRLRLLPQPTPPGHAEPVPAEQPGGGRWSAFVAPDLAPLFTETPWLDLPPGDAAQARTLAGLASIRPDQLATLHRVAPPASPGAAAVGVPPPGTPPAPAVAPHATAAPTPAQAAADFLLSVMHDATAPLPLRVQAAIALLPDGGPR